MQATTLSKVLAISAISFLSLAGGAVQAADNCLLSSLSHPAASADVARGSGDCREAKRGDASAAAPDLVASIAPLMGGMAKTGIHTATSVMQALAHEASQFVQE